MAAALPLSGCRGLVTRLRHQACYLQSEIKALGGIAVVEPMFRLEPLHHKVPADFERAQVLIFVSSNAVHHAIAQIPADLLKKIQHGAVVCWAMGPGTAAALQRHQIACQTPNHFRSEGLLAMPQMAQLRGVVVAIVSGTPSRALLFEALQARGAQVVRYVCYQRRALAPDIKKRTQLAALAINVILVSSGFALDQLQPRLGRWVWRLPVVLPRELRQGAMKNGFKSIVCADNATDHALLQALVLWHATQQANPKDERL